MLLNLNDYTMDLNDYIMNKKDVKLSFHAQKRLI
ncbi:MAG: hypothetical protein PR2021_3820 [Candidatus Phytoplasma pruni]|nr:MAG: hypothetical protein PR2021_3820 [Candidatus Phytoplasma pruni]